MDRSISITSAELKRVESHQYPRTHVGHLDESQQAALDGFKDLAAKDGYYHPSSEGNKASHDDETLLRYLRARKFQPQDALKQFKDTEEWREKNKIDWLYDKIDVTEYDETRKLYPQWTGRRDKRGIPVYVFEVAPLTSKRMAEYDKKCGSKPANNTNTNTSSKMLRLFALYENLTQFALPLCSAVADRPYPETPVSQSNNIVDISRVGLKQFWNLKAHMQDASQLATAYYPETLDRIFIIGAPSFFPTVWSWIKRWFDPITVSKIFILSQGNVKSTLEQYMNIEDIPRKYGGTLDWEWGQLPHLEPSIDKQLVWHNPTKGAQGQNSFPPGPVRWQEAANGGMEAIAVGTVAGKQRSTTVATLKAQMRESKHLTVRTVGEDLYGTPLTGVYTHPRDDEEYFPSSGDTPTSEKDEPSINHLSESGTSESGPEGTQKHAANSGREGTSETRFAQQDYTHAAGILAEGTPQVVDQGDGEKAAVMEPRTVGQAPKDVSLPVVAQTSSEPGDATYVDQAKAAASSVYTTTTSVASTVGSKVMAVVGYSSQEETENKEGQAEDAETKRQAEAGAEDPRVDKMQSTDVEEFVRSQYSSKLPQAE